jgi:hypothetical protein
VPRGGTERRLAETPDAHGWIEASLVEMNVQLLGAEVLTGFALMKSAM